MCVYIYMYIFYFKEFGYIPFKSCLKHKDLEKLRMSVKKKNYTMQTITTRKLVLLY